MVNDGKRKVYQRFEILKVAKYQMNFDKTKLKMAYNCNKLFRAILCHFSIDKQKHTENHNTYYV